MGLPWVRLDSQFPHNPKVLALTEDRKWRALAMYVCALSYCGAHGTNGFIPRGALPFIHGTPKEAAQLVDVGMWRQDAGGWQIPDWAEFQPSSDEVEERRQKMRALANKRWHPDAKADATA